MTAEEVINQLKELIKDRESFMVGDYDKDIYDRDKEALELAVKIVEKQIPNIQSKQKTGRWIYTNTIGGMRYYGCTICTNQEKDCIADENEIQWYNYCPNCGAKMEVNDG